MAHSYSSELLLGTGFLIGQMVAVGVFALSPSSSHPADIGIKFEDSARAATLRDRKALPEGSVEKALNEAFENYRHGRKGVVILKLPPKAPTPGNK